MVNHKSIERKWPEIFVETTNNPPRRRPKYSKQRRENGIDKNVPRQSNDGRTLRTITLGKKVTNFLQMERNVPQCQQFRQEVC